MPTSPVPESNGPVRILESLPPFGLTRMAVNILDAGDAFDAVGPVALFPDDDRVTHIQLARDNTFYYLGWNPGPGQWEQLLTFDLANPESDDAHTITAISVDEDDTCETAVEFDPETEPDDPLAAIIAYVKAYIDYTYEEYDAPRFLPDEIGTH